MSITTVEDTLVSVLHSAHPVELDRRAHRDLEDVYNTERHLLYVACTRARDHLLVTSTAPASEFLDDWDAEKLKRRNRHQELPLRMLDNRANEVVKVRGNTIPAW
jgi:superfamily I DNA/RNA helicase